MCVAGGCFSGWWRTEGECPGDSWERVADYHGMAYVVIQHMAVTVAMDILCALYGGRSEEVV